MKKFITGFLNLLLLCATFVVTTFSEWCIYNIVALPAENSTIAITSKNEDQVTYFDTSSYLGDDLKASVTREPRYMVRSWFEWDWWQNGMKWADVAIETVIGAVVPITAPMYEVSQLKYYYSEYEGHSSIPIQTYDDQTIFTVDCVGIAMGEQSGLDNYIYYSKEDGNGLIYRVSGGETSKSPICVIPKLEKNSAGYARHNDVCKKFLNTAAKINKYNSGDYDKWTKKFLTKDSNGAFIIKSSVSSLYFQFYLAIAASFWFLSQNPLVIKQNDDGNQEISGGIRFKRFSGGRKKDKKGKNK